MRQPRKRLLVVSAIAIAACLPARPGAATLLQSCCACVASENAQTSGFAADAQVFFCAEAEPGDIGGLEQRCEAASNGTATLHCEANIPGPSCQQQLADGGLACPTAGVPAASPLHLLALGAALALLGTAALQRRRRPAA